MNYYLIDFENIRMDGMNDIKDIKNGDSIIIFYADHCKNITIDFMEVVARKNLEFRSFKAKTGTKNALDFQLSSYLGFLIGTGRDTNTSYYIVSNDKGFDCLCDFWGEQNVNVKRFPVMPSAKESAKEMVSEETVKKPKVKVDAGNFATLGEVALLLTQDEDPEKVLAIVNQYKTKQAISNGIAKQFKDSKKAGEIYKRLKPLLKEKKKG